MHKHIFKKVHALYNKYFTGQFSFLKMNETSEKSELSGTFSKCEL